MKSFGCKWEKKKTNRNWRFSHGTISFLKRPRCRCGTTVTAFTTIIVNNNFPLSVWLYCIAAVFNPWQKIIIMIIISTIYFAFVNNSVVSACGASGIKYNLFDTFFSVTLHYFDRGISQTTLSPIHSYLICRFVYLTYSIVFWLATVITNRDITVGPSSTFVHYMTGGVYLWTRLTACDTITLN